MANVKSAIKRVKTNEKATLRNRAARSNMRTAIRRALEALPSGDAEKIEQATRSAVSVIGKTAKKGVIHPRKAARLQSRLRVRVNKALAGGESA